jgi:SAM-dependent methyltransferase
VGDRSGCDPPGYRAPVGRPQPPVPARVAWAVELLEVGAADAILELGCGPGVAAALVCDRLAGGRLTAVDRSATAVARTRARNAHHVDAGRLEVVHTTVAALDGASPDRASFDRASFDKAFAVDVNLFWTGPADAECAVLARLLRPGGVLHLVYGSPGPSRAGDDRDIGGVVAANLGRHGFTATTTRHPDGRLLGVTGRLAG